MWAASLSWCIAIQIWNSRGSRPSCLRETMYESNENISRCFPLALSLILTRKLFQFNAPRQPVEKNCMFDGLNEDDYTSMMIRSCRLQSACREAEVENKNKHKSQFNGILLRRLTFFYSLLPQMHHNSCNLFPTIYVEREANGFLQSSLASWSWSCNTWDQLSSFARRLKPHRCIHTSTYYVVESSRVERLLK